MAAKPAESVTYITDDGKDAYALVLSKDGGNYNLAWLDPDNYTWHAANETPPERVK